MAHDPPTRGYRPLGGPDGWVDTVAPADLATWAGAARRVAVLEAEAPGWSDMVGRGVALASAYRSAALAGLYDADEGVAAGLVSGAARTAACGPVAAPHVVAGVAALGLARAAATERSPLTEAWLRRVHAVACEPQVTHPVAPGHGPPDPSHGHGHGHMLGHVLGHGDYKHHPNDVRTASEWRVRAPVEAVGAEMARLAGWCRGDVLAALHPAARSAYLLHALVHVGPFAAGNGRVARVAASVAFLGALGVPLTVPPGRADAYRGALEAAGAGEPAVLVAFVAACGADAVDEVVRARQLAGEVDPAQALVRWASRVAAAHRLHARLPVAAEAALARHRRRADLGWLHDLADAHVVGPPAPGGDQRFDAAPIVLRVACGTEVVEERLAVDPHPVAGDRDGDVIVVRAVEAGLEIDVRAAEVVAHAADRLPDRPPGGLTDRLDGLLDRAVTALAVRVAARA